MSKINIKIFLIGEFFGIDIQKIRDIKRWKSEIFEVQGEIEKIPLNKNSDNENWEFSDEIFKELIEVPKNSNFVLIITNVPLENNYYSRRIDKKIVTLTFYEIKEFLKDENIQLKNIVLRIIYGYSIIYKNYKEIPVDTKIEEFTHDETRGCVFDMTPEKIDIIYSGHKPDICLNCEKKLLENGISKEFLDTVKREMKEIRKDLFYVILDWVKIHPIYSIIISSIWAVILGAVGSLLASLIN